MSPLATVVLAMLPRGPVVAFTLLEWIVIVGCAAIAIGVAVWLIARYGLGFGGGGTAGGGTGGGGTGGGGTGGGGPPGSGSIPGLKA